MSIEYSSSRYGDDLRGRYNHGYAYASKTSDFIQLVIRLNTIECLLATNIDYENYRQQLFIVLRITLPSTNHFMRI